MPALLQDQSLEDPLDSPEQLHDQLESLSYLCRFQYEQFSEYLCGLMDPILGAYTQALTSPGTMYYEIRNTSRVLAKSVFTVQQNLIVPCQP